MRCKQGAGQGCPPRPSYPPLAPSASSPHQNSLQRHVARTIHMRQDRALSSIAPAATPTRATNLVTDTHQCFTSLSTPSSMSFVSPFKSHYQSVFSLIRYDASWVVMDRSQRQARKSLSTQAGDVSKHSWFQGWLTFSENYTLALGDARLCNFCINPSHQSASFPLSIALHITSDTMIHGEDVPHITTQHGTYNTISFWSPQLSEDVRGPRPPSTGSSHTLATSTTVPQSTCLTPHLYLSPTFQQYLCPKF